MRESARMEATNPGVERWAQRAAQKLADKVFAISGQLAADDFDGPEQPLRSGERVQSGPFRPAETAEAIVRGALSKTNERPRYLASRTDRPRSRRRAVRR